MDAPNDRQANDAALWIAGGLALLVLFVYGQVLRHGFLYYDDGYYVTHNEMIERGLTWDGFLWAWTAVVASMWSPLTLLSHMIDVSLFGMRPGPHHFVNVLFHAINVVLVFHVLRRTTGALWRPAIVAAIWAVHPLRAESVAWASERKDVLSAMFWLLTILAYIRWVEAPRMARYAAVVVLFALGLLAKPMLVTLPFALVLLDFWPLGRARIGDSEGPAGPGLRLRRLVLEKTPLFALSAAAIGITVWSQGSTGAVGTIEQYPIWVRIANSALSYGMYIWTTFVPVNLAVMYPHPGEALSAGLATVSGISLAAISVLALFAWKRFPFVFTGWFWFMGTLVPVIGLVQVGSTSRADRYTYIPQIGLLIAIVWLIPALAEHRPAIRRVAMAAAAIVVIALSALGFRQVSYWRDTITLFSHTVKVSPMSANALFNLGVGYAMEQRPDLAEPAFRRAAELNPLGLGILQNWAASLIEIGKPEEAIDVLHQLMDLDENKPEHYFQLALAYFEMGDNAEAIFQAGEALRIDPEFAPAHDLIERAITLLPPGSVLEAAGTQD